MHYINNYDYATQSRLFKQLKIKRFHFMRDYKHVDEKMMIIFINDQSFLLLTMTSIIKLLISNFKVYDYKNRKIFTILHFDFINLQECHHENI